MEKDSKIYVAGHTGLAGSAIIRALKAKGYTNLLVRTKEELDLTLQGEVYLFFAREIPDYVIIAAATVGGIQANIESPGSYLYDNLMISANIIEFARMFKTKKLLFIGSSCVYPKYAPQPMTEEALLTGSLEPTNEGYAIAKIAGMKMCDYYNTQYKTNFISVMPPNLYGPRDTYNLDTSHALPAFLRKMYLAKCLHDKNFDAIIEDLVANPLDNNSIGVMVGSKKYILKKKLKDHGITNNSITLWGTGSPRREFMHSDDMAMACIYLMNNIDYHDIKNHLNIGMGGDTSLKELAIIMADIIGYKGKIIWDDSHYDGTPVKLLDITKAKALGWHHEVSLRDGIKDTYESYLKYE